MAVQVKVVTTTQPGPAASEEVTVNGPGHSSETVTDPGSGVAVVLHAPGPRVEHVITGAETSSNTVIV